MNYILEEYKRAVVFYIIAGGLLAYFAPWATGPFWLDWISTVIGASVWFFIYVFGRAAVLSYLRRKRS